MGIQRFIENLGFLEFSTFLDLGGIFYEMGAKAFLRGLSSLALGTPICR